MSLRSRKASSFSFVAHHDADFCLPNGYVKPHLFDQTTKRQRFQIPFCYRDGGRVTLGGTRRVPIRHAAGATSRPSNLKFPEPCRTSTKSFAEPTCQT
jgi:hypothetical protein